MTKHKEKHYYQYANPNNKFDSKYVAKSSKGYRSICTSGVINNNGTEDNNEILHDSVDAYLAVCLPGVKRTKRYIKEK